MNTTTETVKGLKMYMKLLKIKETYDGFLNIYWNDGKCRVLNLSKLYKNVMKESLNPKEWDDSISFKAVIDHGALKLIDQYVVLKNGLKFQMVFSPDKVLDYCKEVDESFSIFSNDFKKEDYK